MTKKEIGFNDSYSRAKITDIYQAYKNPSFCKIRAFNTYVKNRVNDYNGFDLRITSANCQFFTVMFKYIDEKTGVVRLKVLTGRNEYDCDCLV